MRLIVAGVAAAVVAVPIGFAIAMPAAAALICPACYGLERLDGRIYGAATLGEADRARIVDLLDAARGRIAEFYGQAESDPVILVCDTPACYRRIGGGGERGKAILDLGLMLAPSGTTETIAAHELAHVELHARVGLIRAWRHTVPAWFDEGLAVVVSDDPRYLKPAAAGDRCLAPDDHRPLPETLAQWLNAAGLDHMAYARAGCRVSAWLAARGGPAAAVRLLREVAGGTPFGEALSRP